MGNICREAKPTSGPSARHHWARIRDRKRRQWRGRNRNNRLVKRILPRRPRAKRSETFSARQIDGSHPPSFPLSFLPIATTGRLKIEAR
eukprot:scaffold167961_cov39-Attheya_sp.AAC.1